MYFSWTPAGNTLVPRQGGQIAVLDGRPTLMGGFYDYDKYPDIVEQFHGDSGGLLSFLYDLVDIEFILGMWFPLKQKLKMGRRYFGVALVPETLFPQCLS